MTQKTEEFSSATAEACDLDQWLEFWRRNNSQIDQSESRVVAEVVSRPVFHCGVSVSVTGRFMCGFVVDEVALSWVFSMSIFVSPCLIIVPPILRTHSFIMETQQYVSLFCCPKCSCQQYKTVGCCHRNATIYFSVLLSKI